MDITMFPCKKYACRYSELSLRFKPFSVEEIEKSLKIAWKFISKLSPHHISQAHFYTPEVSTRIWFSIYGNIGCTLGDTWTLCRVTGIEGKKNSY